MKFKIPLPRTPCYFSNFTKADSSAFLKALPQESHLKIPHEMLKFHVDGGVCRGPLRVERFGIISNIICYFGQLPTVSDSPIQDVVVTSKICPESDSLFWTRQFPSSPIMQSQWYYDEKEQLAVDSFSFMGIPNFARFGLKLVPINTPHFETTGFQGFHHLSSKLWILGMPLPSFLEMKADGLSMPHEDGKGWRVEVLVEHAIFGKIVSYSGDVRLCS